MKRCPICKKKLIPPRGPVDSPFLILAIKPAEKDLEFNRPMAGYPGKVLRMELSRVNLDMLNFRISNLMLHEVHKKGTVLTEECFEWNLEQAVAETKDRKMILLMGSDVVQAFCGVNVMSVSGLQVKSHLISSKTKIFAAPAPGDAIHGGVGEVRLAIQNFSSAYTETKTIAELGY